ncbi:hypothetical protein [Lacinutrix himadriensis]|uniref:hypothetical protein n=1 Tax=Lacinutrix himadriensis TaxID=641549 RepID=UPI000A96AC5C|nr:hypothetical protein [Lacinutrix himadriensis]
MKNLKNLGKALTKAEQRTINGGRACRVDLPCPEGYKCVTDGNPWGFCRPARPIISPF